MSSVISIHPAVEARLLPGRWSGARTVAALGADRHCPEHRHVHRPLGLLTELLSRGTFRRAETAQLTKLLV